MAVPSSSIEDPSLNNNLKIHIFDTRARYTACKKHIRNQKAHFDMLMYMENQLDRCYIEIANQSDQLDISDEDQVAKVKFLMARFDGFVNDVNTYEMQKKELYKRSKSVGTLSNANMGNKRRTQNNGNRKGKSKISNNTLAFIGSDDNTKNLIGKSSHTEKSITEIDYLVGLSNCGSLNKNEINVYKTNNGSFVSESNHTEFKKELKVKKEISNENMGKSLQPNNLSTKENKGKKNKDEVVGNLEIGSDATRCEKGGNITNEWPVDNISHFEIDGSVFNNFDHMCNYESNRIDSMDYQLEINENEVQSRNAANLSSVVEEAKEKVPNMSNEELGKHMIPKNDLQSTNEETNVLSITKNHNQNLGNSLEIKVENIKNFAKGKKSQKGKSKNDISRIFSDYNIVTRSKSKELDAMRRMIHADEIYKGNVDLTTFVKKERDWPLKTSKSAPEKSMLTTYPSPQIKNEIKSEIADINKIQNSFGHDNKNSKRIGQIISQIAAPNLDVQQNQADNNADKIEESASPKIKRRKYIRKK